MRMMPLKNNLLVKQQWEEPGVIWIKAEKLLRGEVMAIGPGRRIKNGELRPINGVKIGDTVLFGEYATEDKINLNGEEHIVINEFDIAGVVDD